MRAMLSRKEFVKVSLISSFGMMAGIGATEAGETVAGSQNPPAGQDISIDDLKAAARLFDVEFTDEELRALLGEMRTARNGYRKVRELNMPYTASPRTVFTPIGGGSRAGAKVSVRTSRPRIDNVRGRSDEDLAFLSVRDLGHLIRTRQLTSRRLTEIYLRRLEQFGPELLCVVTLTKDLALAQADRADREIAAGKYRGPLHGIPYGVKDLFATKGIKTTWGAEPYKDQVFDYDATVVKRLEAAGAVLVAKLTTGALALGDVWYGGTTKNPWNLSQGSSGSSAGSASATAAGLVAFAIGTETLGSIASPSVRCRTTGFRPTFGRVSRYGAMELCYTMDKVGPICREIEDCALVLAAICGEDAGDPAAVSRDFQYRPRRDLKGIKIGVQRTQQDSPMARAMAEAGAELVPHQFSPVTEGVLNVLDIECGSAFDAFTRSDAIDQLKNSPWPATFRGARFYSAVEYLQMMRARTLLMEKFEAEFGDLDAYLASGIGDAIVHTNLTGHPQAILPFGDDGRGNSVAFSLVGRLYADDRLLEIARVAQEKFEFHRRRPALKA